jgi:hypothetical protein
MRRLLTTFAALGLAACFVVTVQGQDQGADEAMKLARKLTEQGAATFNTANAKAMADYYTADAKVTMHGRNDQGISPKEYDGREEIQGLYADVFKNRGTIRSKNTVEYARLLASDVLVIAGTFEPNLDADKPLKVPFYQVRLKQGDKWLINNLQIFVVGEKKE